MLYTDTSRVSASRADLIIKLHKIAGDYKRKNPTELRTDISSMSYSPAILRCMDGRIEPRLEELAVERD